MPKVTHHRQVRPDVVTLRVARSLRTGRVFITGASVIGSAPCSSTRETGDSVGPAIRCLCRNGFRVVCVAPNVIVLVRYRRNVM